MKLGWYQNVIPCRELRFYIILSIICYVLRVMYYVLSVMCLGCRNVIGFVLRLNLGRGY